MYSIFYSWIIDVEKHRKLLFSVCGWFVALCVVMMWPRRQCNILCQNGVRLRLDR